MKSLTRVSVLVVLALLSAGNAWADRGRGHNREHVHFGIAIGPWAPWYFPPPYYYPPAYYPPVVVTQPAPQVYIEQAPPPPAAATPAPPAYYWYYCNESQTYYPYVKECPSGWQKVSPQPPAQP